LLAAVAALTEFFASVVARLACVFELLLVLLCVAIKSKSLRVLFGYLGRFRG
jgi:hypothetical protein